MTDAELAVVKEALQDVEKLIPEIIAAEVAKMSGPYAPAVSALVAAAMPALISALDQALQKKIS